MIKNYLKIAFRNLSKQKVFSFINIFGLATGLTCFLLISLYIFDELTFDRFHKNADHIYRVVEQKTSAEGKEKTIISVAANISRNAKKEFPEVADATRFSILGRTNLWSKENNNVFYESFCLADESFLKVFDFPLIEGDRATALSAPHSVVITKETALKFFGKKNVVGKTLMEDTDSVPYRITAVIDIPTNSHLDFNVLFSESSLQNSKDFMDFFNNDWSSNTFVTYFLLKNKDVINTATKIDRVVKDRRQPGKDGTSRFALQPLRDIHFYSAGFEGNTDKPGNLTHMYIFGVVALFVLLIACINYMNLTTAKYAGRWKEIALRKVVGASRSSLVRQFLTEAFLLTGIALLIALGMTYLLLPYFNQFTEKQLNLYSDPRIWVGIVAITIIVGLLSGLYPAVFQSGLRPWLLLKNRGGVGKSNLSVRQLLVVFQFSLSIIMIIATIVVYRQMKYVDTAAMGFNKDQLLVIDINSGAVRRSAETIKTEFAKIPAVQSVAISSRVPGEWKTIPAITVRTPGTATTTNDAFFIGIDESFLSTYEVKLLSGRNFLPASGDSSSVILNEAAARMLGITKPAEQPIEIPSLSFSGNVSSMDQPFNTRVIGIVQDFNFQSMREKVAPMVLGYRKNPLHNIDYFTARVDANNIPATLKSMETVLRKIDAAHLFEYNFLDKQWDLFYREDTKRQTIFFAVAILTILIACLGLFGLATYAAQQRVKEIGIRKVLGASIGGIVTMLSKEFLKLVLLSSLIAFPVAWWAMNNWLKDFAYRINIGIWVFVFAAGIALLIAFITISTQAIKAATANPVKSLRTE